MAWANPPFLTAAPTGEEAAASLTVSQAVLRSVMSDLCIRSLLPSCSGPPGTSAQAQTPLPAP